MPYLFDNLPLDMIQFEIFPYLDYDSRVTANLMLPPVDRVRTPLKKDAALQLAIAISEMILRKYLIKATVLSGQQRNRATLKFYRELPKYFYILEYRAGFREAIIEKSIAFSNPDGEEYINTTTHMKKTLPGLCAIILDMAAQRPFIRQVEGHFTKLGWAAVTNANPLIVVDNDTTLTRVQGRKCSIKNPPPHFSVQLIDRH